VNRPSAQRAPGHAVSVRRSIWFTLIAVAAVTRPALAQHTHDTAATTVGWTWSVSGQAFLNSNVQVRKFRDFHVVEIPHWLMVDASRSLGRARLRLHGMASFEKWTFGRYGSSQVFQTGETFDGAALVDYQHPHDLVMAANARLEWPTGSRWTWHLEGGPVGAPALGPLVFMHRASAGPNPTAPLTHHFLDATHVTHGVITAGLTAGAFTLEASGFHGRESDEDRVRVEFGPIDSYAARLAWRRGAWHAQVSAAHVKFPDPTEFTDHDIVTASASHTGSWRSRPWATTFALSVVREAGFGVTLPAALIESTWEAGRDDVLYVRGEIMKKDILTRGGYDPPDFVHPHILSRIGALTIGYERRVASTRAGTFGIGGDATIYARDETLEDNYGRPFSAHVFLRYRLGR